MIYYRIDNRLLILLQQYITIELHISRQLKNINIYTRCRSKFTRPCRVHSWPQRIFCSPSVLIAWPYFVHRRYRYLQIHLFSDLLYGGVYNELTSLFCECITIWICLGLVSACLQRETIIWANSYNSLINVFYLYLILCIFLYYIWTI